MYDAGKNVNVYNIITIIIVESIPVWGRFVDYNNDRIKSTKLLNWIKFSKRLFLSQSESHIIITSCIIITQQIR